MSRVTLRSPLLPVHFASRRVVLSGALAALAGSAAGCQTAAGPTSSQPQAATLGPDRIGYLLLNAPIAPASAAFFEQQINKFADLGAREVHIAMNSPGGVIPSALAMIDFMNRTHDARGITFVTHDVGLVASAACYVFLAGQRRLSNQRANFLFHEAGVSTTGVLTGQNLQEASDQLQRDEDVFLRMLKLRTHLTDGEATTFVRRTVILTPDEARRDGITDATVEFTVPAGVTIAAIATRPRSGPAPSPTPTPPIPSG